MAHTRIQHRIATLSLAHNGIHLVPSTSSPIESGHVDRSNLLYRAGALAAALFLVITLF